MNVLAAYLAAGRSVLDAAEAAIGFVTGTPSPDPFAAYRVV